MNKKSILVGTAALGIFAAASLTSCGGKKEDDKKKISIALQYN